MVSVWTCINVAHRFLNDVDGVLAGHVDIYMYHAHAWARGSQKRALDTLELEV